MTYYSPDAWCILKISNKGKIHYRVFAGWYGGYGCGDSWRCNSGIVSVHVDGDYYEFVGESGSVYRCHRETERMTGYMSHVYADRIAQNTNDIHIECVPYSEMDL